MKKYYIQTFGCSMNQADSEKINMILLQSGFIKVSEWKHADVVIFNTCSVRQKGEDRVFGMAHEIKKENQKRLENAGKETQIIVGITGCMVRKTGMNTKYLLPENIREKPKNIELLENEKGIFNADDGLFPRLKELDFTLRIEEVKYLTHILTHIYQQPIGVDHSFDDYLKQAQWRENSSQAQVIIQTGCDNYCTFCIVPYTRGKEISRPLGDILEEVKKAKDTGATEVVLIGQNVNSYGKQFHEKKLWNEEKSHWNEGIGKSPFRELLEGINDIGIPRIRFTSSNPHDMTQDILDAHFELPSTCNYLHFALQSGSNAMLKKMNRKHTYEEFKKMVDYLRSHDPLFAISTDIIVGYSGETQEMFEETLKAVEECEFDFIYNARYSVRAGTIASKIYPDDVPDEVKAERWHILNNMLKKNVDKRNAMMIGRVEEVMISGEKDDQFFGRTRNFKEVFFTKKPSFTIGDMVNVKILQLDKWVLKGEIIE